MELLGPLLLALMAAVGNALFATGQKKAIAVENELALIVLSALCGAVLVMGVMPLFGPPRYGQLLRQNGLWVLMSGLGLCLTYIGFNLLYTRYGASYYVLYAVLSMMTTAIVVGAGLFREVLNGYHWMAIATAIATVVLFTLGNQAR